MTVENIHEWILEDLKTSGVTANESKQNIRAL